LEGELLSAQRENGEREWREREREKREKLFPSSSGIEGWKLAVVRRCSVFGLMRGTHAKIFHRLLLKGEVKCRLK